MYRYKRLKCKNNRLKNLLQFSFAKTEYLQVSASLFPGVLLSSPGEVDLVNRHDRSTSISELE